MTIGYRIATIIPDDSPCYVHVDGFPELDAKTAIELGEQIAAAGKRTLIMNALRDLGYTKPMLDDVIKKLGQLK